MNLNYRFRPSHPTVNPGSKLAVPGSVKPQGLRLVGPQTTHRFILSARPVDGDEKDAKEVQGELVHKPWFRGWKWPVILTILGLLLLFFIVVKPDINPCGRQFFLFPAPNGISQARFYYGMFCDNYDFKPFQAKREDVALPPEACHGGEGLSQVQSRHEELLGRCIDTEWYDDFNAHQRTTKGRLMWVPKPHKDAADARLSQIYFFA